MLRTWCSPTTHLVFFGISYFCNNVVFGALLGWARRNERISGNIPEQILHKSHKSDQIITFTKDTKSHASCECFTVILHIYVPIRLHHVMRENNEHIITSNGRRNCVIKINLSSLQDISTLLLSDIDDQGSNQALLVSLPLRYQYRRHAADTLNKERHAADTLEIILLFLIHLKITRLSYPSKTRGADAMLV